MVKLKRFISFLFGLPWPDFVDFDGNYYGVRDGDIWLLNETFYGFSWKIKKAPVNGKWWVIDENLNIM